jgi:zinc transporter
MSDRHGRHFPVGRVMNENVIPPPVHLFSWAYRFDSHGVATEIPPDQQADIDICHEGFVWLHLDVANARVKDWVNRHAKLPANVRAMLTAHGERNQLHADDDLIWGIVPDFTRDLTHTTGDISELRFVVAERFVISARRKPLQAIENTRESVKSGRKVEAPMALLEAIIARVADAFETRTEAISEELSRMEDRVIGDRVRRERDRLGPIRREIVKLVRQLHGLRGVFHRLDVSPDVPISEQTRQTAGRLYQRMDTLWHDAHALQERARLLQDEIAAKLAAETNRQLYILTILATLIMPPTFITGMFGMNVKGLLFGEREDGFNYAIMLCAASVVVTLFSVWFVDRLLKPVHQNARSVRRASGQ